MPKMSDQELKSILQAEKLDALAAIRASKLSTQRTDAMDYYMGDMSKDMPAEDGRSRAVSTDVADTVEGLMPQLMDIFAATDDVVKFDAVGPEDEQAAQQETDYVNHVFMQQNAGFLTLYSFIKDALLSKVGVAKVWWEETEAQSKETYYDQPDEAFAMLVTNPEVEIIEHSEKLDPAAQGMQLPPGMPPPMLHDVTLVTKKVQKRARVMGVPPEEFGISKNARNLRDCGYCFHEVLKRQGELIGDGFDEAQIKQIPTYTALTNPEEISRDTVDEHLSGGGDEGANPNNRMIKVTEHHIQMDYEGNGRPQYYRVTTAGDQGDVLKRNGKLDIEEEETPPFAAMTPIIITHRFFGRSLADRVMDLQRINTALTRAMLDNTYLAVKPRVEVAESHASENTLDDLLVSRPGGVIRTKMPGGLNWQQTPSIIGEIMPVMEYMGSVREWRTGVSRAGQGLDANALQNQSATAANQLFTAAQAQMKLIARIFAETGIRDLFWLLHAIIRKHGDKAQTVRLRNQWVTVDPRDWKERNDMTINVGLGTGSKGEQLARLGMLASAQEKLLMAGKTNMVSDVNLHNTAKEMAKLSGHKDPDMFFTDPKGQPAPQPPVDPKMMEIQAKQQAEQQKIVADAAHQKMKTQADVELQAHKLRAEIEKAEREFQLKAELAKIEAEFKAREHAMTMQHAERAHAMKMQENQATAAAKIQATKTPKASIEVKHGAEQLTGPLADVIERFGQNIAASHAHVAQSQAEHTALLMQAISKPKRARKGADGSWTVEHT